MSSSRPAHGSASTAANAEAGESGRFEESRSRALLASIVGAAFFWSFLAGAAETLLFSDIEFPTIGLKLQYAATSGLLLGVLGAVVSLAAAMVLLALAGRTRSWPALGLALPPIVAIMLPVSLAATFWLHKSVLGFRIPAASLKGLLYTLGLLGAAALFGFLILWLLAAGIKFWKMARGATKTLAVLGALLAVSTGAMLLVSRVGSRSAMSGSVNRTNVLLISVDSVRQDVWDEYLAEHASPALASFARQSRRFEANYTTWSQSLPSHASMLTGLYPFQHGARLQRVEGAGRDEDSIASPVRGDVDLLQSRLAHNGYQTAAIVHNAWLGPPWGLDRGFATFINGGQALRLGVFAPLFATSTSMAGRILYHADQHVFRQLHAGTRLYREWIRHRDRDKPFFIFFHLMEMHVPTDPPPAAHERFASGPFGHLNGRQLRRAIRSGEVSREQMPEAIRHCHNLSLAMLSEVDRFLVSTLETLDEEGLTSETLVILTSDHGDDFYEKAGVLEHEHVYETVARVPLLIRVPGDDIGGSASDTRTSLVDLAPTIYRFVGLEAPELQAGIDLLDAEALAAAADRRIFIQGVHPDGGLSSALVSRRFKLIANPDGSQELYDLLEDPGELHDRVAVNENAVTELAEELDILLASTESYEADLIDREELSPELVEKLKALGYLQ